MKHILTATLTASILAGAGLGQAEDAGPSQAPAPAPPVITTAPPPAPAPAVRPAYPRELNPPWALFRGVANLATGWLELPRNLVIEHVNYPVLGLGTGWLKGLFFMTSRVVLSVVDIGMFGMTGPSAYSPDVFPEFVFQAQWNPYAPVTAEDQSLQVEFEELDAVDENMETPY